MALDEYFFKQFNQVAEQVTPFLQGEVTRGDKFKDPTKDPTKPDSTWSLRADILAKAPEGFCFGASLDWLRKVILSDGGRIAVSHYKQSRIERMASAQDYLVNASNLHDVEIRKGIDLKIESERDKYKKWLKANNVNYGLDEDGDPTNPKSSDSTIQPMVVKQVLQYNELLSELGAAHNKWKAMKKGEQFQRSWKTTQQNLVSLEGKGRSRSFSQLKVVRCNATDRYTDYRTFLCDAFQQADLTVGRGIILGIELIPKPGHFIAVSRDKETSYHLFDPNIGIYRCASRRHLLYALLVLAEVGYVKVDRRLGYQHDWKIFCKTKETVPALADKKLADGDGAAVKTDVDKAGKALEEYAKKNPRPKE